MALTSQVTPTDGFTLHDVQQHSQQPEVAEAENKPYNSYHVSSLLHVVNDALKYHSQLLTDFELSVAQTITKSLSGGAVYLFARLFRRKHDQWHPMKSLEQDYKALLPENSDIEGCIDELLSHHFLLSTTVGEKVHETALVLLPTLSLDKLKSVWKMVPSATIRQSKRTIVNEVADLLSKHLERENRSTTDSSKSGREPNSKKRKVFRQSTLTSIPPATRVAKAITKTVGPAVRLTEQVTSALDRLNFLVLLDEDAHTSPNFILSFTNRLRFPEYECIRETPVFPSKEALASFEAARCLERTLEEAIYNRSVRKANGLSEADWPLAVEIGNLADKYVRDYLGLSPAINNSNLLEESKLDHECPAQDKEELSSQLSHPFLKRYTSHWVYCRVLWHSISAVERMEEYEVAVERLKLLHTLPLSAKRRGKVLERLTIDLSKHLKRPREALDITLAALDESAKETAPLRVGDSQALANRALKLHYQLNIGEEVARAGMKERLKAKRIEKAKKSVALAAKPIQLYVLNKDFPTTEFIRTPISTDPPKKRLKTWLTPESSSDSIKTSSRVWFASLNDENIQVTVEELALEYYASQGWDGRHSEGGAFALLFALVLWIQLFEKVPDVFVSPYQDRPLDLYTDAFYKSRKESIDLRLENIQQMSVEELEQEIRNVFERHEGTIAVGARNWTGFTKDEIATVAGGLGGKSVSKICLLLAKDYAYYRSGIADLVLWKRDEDEKSCPSCKLVEVKSENDKLSSKQIGWFSALNDFGVNFEVFQVKSKKQDN